MVSGQWYHIKIYIDYENQNGDVWIATAKNDSGEWAYTQIVNDGALRQQCFANGIFWVRAWRLETDTYYWWDNFNFYIDK